MYPFPRLHPLYHNHHHCRHLHCCLLIFVQHLQNQVPEIVILHCMQIIASYNTKKNKKYRCHITVVIYTAQYCYN